MKILIATPHKFNFSPQYVANLVMLTHQFRAGMNFTLMLPECGLLHDIRNQCVKYAQEGDFDLLLFIDTDMDFPADSFTKLLALRADIATGIYVQRQPPHRPVVYNFTDGGSVKNFASTPDIPFKVEACGAGMLLIRKKVLQDPKMVGFFNYIPLENGTWLSEDNSFCKRAKDAGYTIMADPSIPLGHQMVSMVTIENYKAWKYSSLGVVQGWMTNKEMDWLGQLAMENNTVVEIGSWKGRSTRALLSGGALVYAVDHFQGSADEHDHTNILAKEEDIYEQFLANTSEYTNLVVKKMSSEEAGLEFEDKSVDAVFIDSDHSYEAVKAEIERWLPKVKRIICGHDYSDEWPGVKQAVVEKFGKVGFKVHESIWYKELI